MTKAIILLSGGQDSTTCLFWALQKFEHIRAIGFDYGQSHKAELIAAAEIAISLNIEFDVVMLNAGSLRAHSSLTRKSDHNIKSQYSGALPASFTPGRNILFLTIAASHGAHFGINDIVTGVCQTDFDGYPDCRRSTIDAIQLALTLGMGVGDFRIYTPLMYLTKAETWKLAKELGCLEVVREKTVTDYNALTTRNEWGMGDVNNPASALRAKGYYEAKEKGWI